MITTTEQKMRVGFSLALALAVVLGALAYHNLQALIRLGDAARRTLTVILEMDRTLSTLTDAETGQRGYLITGDATYLGPYNRAATELGAHLQALDRLSAGDAPTAQDVARLRGPVAAKMAELAQTVALRRDRGFGAARRVVVTDAGQADMDAIRRVLGGAEARETRAWERQRRQRSAAIRATQWQVGLLIGAEFALLSWAYGLARRGAEARARARAIQEAQSRELEAQHEELLAQQSQLVVTAREMAAANSRLEYASRRFEELYQALPIPCYCHDTDGRIFEWNRAFETCHGLTSEQIFQRRIWDAIGAPEAEGALRASITSAFAGEPQRDWELTLRGPDSPSRNLLCSTVPMRGPGGQVTGGISTHLDITGRKATEDALQESRRFAQSIADHSTSLIFVFDLDTRANVYANRSIGDFLGYTPAEVAALGAGLLPVMLHPDDLPRILAHFEEFADTADGEVVELEYRARHADGSWRWVWCREVVFKRRPDGTPRQIMGTAQDVTRRKAVEEALRVSEARLRAFHDITAAPEDDLDGKIARLLHLGCREFGMSTGVVAHMDEERYQVRHAVSPDGAHGAGFACDSSDTLCREVVREGRPVAIADVGGTHWRRHPAYALFGVESYFGAPLRAAGEDWGTLCFNGTSPRAAFTPAETDFLRLLAQWIGGEVERCRGQQRVQDSEERFRSAIGSMHEGLMLQDAAGTVLLCNAAAERILGVSAEGLLHRPAIRAEWRIVRADGSALPRDEQPAIRALATGRPQPDVVLGVERADGGVTWLSMNAAPLFHDGEEAPYAAVQTFADVTERRSQEAQIHDYTVVLEFQKRELEAQKQEVETQRQKLEMQKRILERTNMSLEVANSALESLATLDGLTGLKNHRAFQERLEAEVIRSQRYGQPLSLIMLDVDHFKQYNDTYGHPAGDEVLRTVGLLLEQNDRETDFAARYGGEEFVVILPNADGEGARIVAERLRESIASQDWPDRPITASLGVSTLTPAMADRAALVAAADGALYRAKAAGRDRAVHAADPAAPSARAARRPAP